ncbi:MAG: homocysteine S-methyltransferase [Gemmatimonadetes bacterium]|nr:homocysteine S-methyltransferase [Gemmatimonadota bacterium]
MLPDISAIVSRFVDAAGCMMLDGGLATELEALGHDLRDDLWSARLLIDNADDIKRVHRSYLESGADCIITSSYQATIPGFKTRGCSQSEAERLLTSSVDIAVAARDEFWSVESNRAGRVRPVVAASVGPYGAALADGSEYRGDYGVDQDFLYDFHRPRWRILADTDAELIACETIPSAVESRALLSLLKETPEREAWFSFTCRDDERLSDGTLLADVARDLCDESQVLAIGINCTAPVLMIPLIETLRKSSDKPVVVYPNSGERYDSGLRAWDGTRETAKFSNLCVTWRKSGAKLIGGCCRTHPRDISAMRRVLTVS